MDLIKVVSKIVVASIKVWSYIPFAMLYPISSVLSLYLNTTKIWKIASMNFYRVYPNQSRLENWKSCHRYFRASCDYFVELMKLSRFSESQMLKHCKIVNPEVIEEMIDSHKFVLCMSGHFVNFEMLISAPLILKDIGMCHLYKSVIMENKLSEWLLETRSRFGAVNIPSKSPLRTLFSLNEDLNSGRSKYRGYIFGSLSDMDPLNDDKFSAPFLGYQLEVKTGAEKIARRMDMGFAYAHMKRVRRGYYEVQIIPLQPLTTPDEDPHAYTREFVRQLDLNVREQPEIWMQWGEYRF